MDNRRFMYNNQQQYTPTHKQSNTTTDNKHIFTILIKTRHMILTSYDTTQNTQ